MKLFSHYLLLACWFALVVFPCSSAFAADPVRYFDIWEYQVEGNSLLQPAQVQSALYPFLGPAKSLDDIEQARAALQALYKHKGYPIVVVAIPEQNVIGGVVRLQVVEGTVGRFKISGNRYFSRRVLREEMPSIEEGKPLNMQSVRAELDAANKLNAYRNLTPVIRPGRKPGTMELELKVQDQLPLYGSVEVNNRYTATTSKTRLMLSAGYDNLWQAHHSVSLNYQMAPQEPGEVDVLNLTYVLLLGESSRLAMFAVDSKSETATVTDQGDDLLVLGNGQVLGMRGIFSSRVNDDYFSTLVTGFDYKDFGEQSEISNPDDTSRQNVPIDYTTFTVTYNGTLKHNLDLTRFSIGAVFAFRSLGNDDMVTEFQDEFDYKRALAEGNFFITRASISRNWSVSENVQLYASLKGQYTENPLISNEQFSAGGVDTVRGYLESSALGDNAVLGNLEAHYNLLPLADWKKLNELDLSCFIDFARLRTLEALPNADGEVISYTDLLGAGIGLTASAYKSLDLALFWAAPLKDLDSDDFDDDSKLHFRVNYRF